jgi:hypothetical protein
MKAFIGRRTRGKVFRLSEVRFADASAAARRAAIAFLQCVASVYGVGELGSTSREPSTNCCCCLTTASGCCCCWCCGCCRSAVKGDVAACCVHGSCVASMAAAAAATIDILWRARVQHLCLINKLSPKQLSTWSFVYPFGDVYDLMSVF